MCGPKSNLTHELVVAAIAEHGSARAAAEVLGVGHQTVLNWSREREAWKAYWATPNPDTFNALVTRMQPIITCVVREFVSNDHEFVDLVQEANIIVFGLIPKVNPTKPNPDAYMQYILKLRIIDYLRKHGSLKRNVCKRSRINTIAANTLAHELGHSLSTAERETACRPNNILRRKILFDVQGKMYDEHEFEFLVRGLCLLDKVIMFLYYKYDYTMNQIAIILKLSESRISQLHTDAILQLRRNSA